MASNKYVQIVNKLVSKTKQRELDWKETADPDTFQMSFANFSITLSEEKQRNETLYKVSILNSEGKEIDYFTDESLEEQTSEPDTDYFTILKSLYQDVRRQALGAEKALDEILNELEDEQRAKN